MKRLFFLAALVAVLASCEKHEIQNEVINEIGFTSKIGKQTKAIAQNETYTNDAISTYFKSQPFGVYAYGHNVGISSTDSSTVMNNVVITYQDPDWKAAGTTKYYWPNDSRTYINFYAYSPYNGDAEGAATQNHKKLNGSITIDKTDGFKLANYTHSNMYVDFMIADPKLNQKYETNDGVVKLNFKHKLTQLNFNVSCNEYPNIDFAIKEIKLVHIKNKATYTQNNNTWKYNAEDTTSYVVYPAKTFDAGTDDFTTTDETLVTVKNYGGNSTPVSLTTTAMTVIPQTLIAKNNDGAQYIRIKYEISGTGVATEEVIRYVYFNGIEDNAASNAAAITWDANKKITYNLIIGLKEIKFSPEISDWDDVTSDGIEVIQ